MANLKSTLILVTGLFFLSGTSLSARPVPDWDLEALFKKAPVVVIAKPIAVDDQRMDPSNTKTRVAVLTTFKIVQVLKGRHKDDKLVLFHYRFPDKYRPEKNDWFYVNFKAERDGFTYLLFLRQIGNGRYECITGQDDPRFSVKTIVQYWGY